MQSQHYVWNPTKKKRIQDIPKHFEGELELILRKKYCEEGLSLSAVQQYIHDEHNVPVEERQLSYRVKKYGLLKKNHQDSPSTVRAYDRDESSSSPATTQSGTTPRAPISVEDIELEGQNDNVAPSSSPTLLKTIKPLVLKLADGPKAVMDSHIERFHAILGTVFNESEHHRDSNLTNMSATEVSFTKSLALVLSCCGWSEQAVRCLKLLTHYCCLQGLSCADTVTNPQSFFHSTKVLAWLLEVGERDLDLDICIGLWMMCQESKQNQDRCSISKQRYTRAELCAVVHLGLTAYNRGRVDLYERARTLWNCEKVFLFDWSYGQTFYFQKPFECLDKAIQKPAAADTPKPLPKYSQSLIVPTIKNLLLWIQKQLSGRPTFLEQVNNTPESWHQIYSSINAEDFEQQLLLAYLSHRASIGSSPTGPSLSHGDILLLPRSIYMEWLSDSEVPIFTLAALSHLAKGDWSACDQFSASTVEGWSERRLNAVRKLLANLEDTVGRFSVLVGDKSFPYQLFPPFRFQHTGVVQPGIDNLLLLPSIGGLAGGPDHSAMIFSLLCSTVLFGSDSVPVEQERLDDPQPPVIADAPFSEALRFSDSSFKSLRSVYLRGRERVNRNSLSSCGSLYLQRFSLSRSSMASLFGQPYNSGRASFRQSLRHGQDEHTAVNERSDMMDLDG